MKNTNAQDVSFGLRANKAFRKYENSAVMLGLVPIDKRTSLVDYAKNTLSINSLSNLNEKSSQFKLNEEQKELVTEIVGMTVARKETEDKKVKKAKSIQKKFRKQDTLKRLSIQLIKKRNTLKVNSSDLQNEI